MNTYFEQKKKSHVVKNTAVQKQRSLDSTLQFVDHRPEAVAQRKLQNIINNSPQIKLKKSLQNVCNNNSIEKGVLQRFTEEQMKIFYDRQKAERQAELQRLNNGFIMNGAFQPGSVFRGAIGLARSRFDLSEIQDEEQSDRIEETLSIGTRSHHLNQLVARVGMELFARMLRNVRRLNEDNRVREAANRSEPRFYRPFSPQTDPSRAVGAESARLKVKVNQGICPHYDYNQNEISLMTPSQMDQSAHELRHAYDHLHKDLDLSIKDHRIASELHAFTSQDIVSHELTGSSPQNFEGISPEEMARSYEGKDSKGYTGTLESSMESVRRWKEKK